MKLISGNSQKYYISFIKLVYLISQINLSIHNIFNLRDTEVVICIILDLLKRVDRHHHYFSIRQYDIIVNKYSTLNQNIMANTMFRHLSATYISFFNKVLMSLENTFIHCIRQYLGIQFFGVSVWFGFFFRSFVHAASLCYSL